MKLNINDRVRVRLTDHGREVHAKNHSEVWAFMPLDTRPEYCPPCEDENGWSEWPLWVLISDFGSHVYFGGPLCFETTIELVLQQRAPEQAVLEKAVAEYVEEYEMRGEAEDGQDACYTPNEREKALLLDALMGFDFGQLNAARVTEMEQQLAFANDAAAKGDAARALAGGMEMEIAELRSQLEAAKRALQACKPYVGAGYRTITTQKMIEAVLKEKST